MGKTIYIQIDNNSLPEGCGEDVEVLDCCCINDFCSLVGDALVGDLKNENGKPLYRLINPVGKLLMDFKAVNEKSFDSIVEEWYDILGNLLHKGIQEDDIEIKFPQQYVDWLLHSDNPYYEQVGKELQRRNGKITLSTEAIDDDIIASLNYKVSHLLQEKKEDFSFVVFSNPIIRNSSFVIKMVRLEGLEFMHYDSWIDNMRSKDIIFKVCGIPFKMIYVENIVDSYYIGETQVTQELWQSVMGSNPSYFKGPNQPVENVSWYDCKEFVKKLNLLTGKQFRLPNVEEWEFAANGGLDITGYAYSGSNIIDEVAWYSANADKDGHIYGTHDVKTKKANELGIFDMSGNVHEWCAEFYDMMPDGIKKCPIRGGSFMSSEGVCLLGNPYVEKPECQSKNIGLRLCLKSLKIV